VSGLAANAKYYSKIKTEANPDVADFGLEPITNNVLIHTHAFAAISHVRMHPIHGCHLTNQSSNWTLTSLYQFDPNLTVIGKFRDSIAKPDSKYYNCIKAIRSSTPAYGKKLVLDLWRQHKYAPEKTVFPKLSLLLANNVGNLTNPYCVEKGFYCADDYSPYNILKERPIGVRAVSVWHAIFRHVHLKNFPRQKRLLLCCCMNIDAKHGQRSIKLKELSRYPEFQCANPAASRNRKAKNLRKILGPPPSDLAKSRIEIDIEDSLQNMKKYALRPNVLDVHMPLLLFNSRFVFSPNGVAEACFREYESILAGAYPLIDATSWYPRRTLLGPLPVVPIANWSTVTPQFLHQTWLDYEQKSFDIRTLFLPFYYDLILTAVDFFSSSPQS